MPIINKLEQLSNKKYNQDDFVKRNMRIIADHIRASVFIIADGVTPLNVGQGYVLRRLLRRSINCCKRIGLDGSCLKDLVPCIIDIYKDFYTDIADKCDMVSNVIMLENEKFSKTLEQGLKEFEKVSFYCKDGKLSGKTAFRLYDTFGFPFELTKELCLEKNLFVDEQEYLEAFKNHQEKSRANNDKVFKGGLADNDIRTTRLHTAVHILQAGLRKLIDPDIYQKGSNITSERLRFDFNCDHKLTEEEKKQLEDFVNEVIKRDIPVVCEEMSLDMAKKEGALGVFEHKYGEKVKVYTIGDVSKEICGGPHASHTGELKHFKIQKEESSGAGIRRIKATID